MKNWFQNLKISVKLSIICSLVLIIMMTTMGYILLQSIRKASFEIAEKIAVNEADMGNYELTGQFEIIKNRVRYLKEILLNGRETKSLTRNEFIHLLYQELQTDPYILALYTVWEPNKFDGKDKYWINKQGNDSMGRFVPYVARSRDKIILLPVRSFSTANYYLIPEQTKKFSLIPPYYYNVEGENIYMISLIEPLLDKNNNFMGIVGADLKVDTVQNIICKIRPLNGYSFLVASNDLIVAHGLRSDLIGKKLYNTGIMPDTKSKMQKKQKFVEHSYSTVIKGNILRVFEPIKLTGTNQIWYFVIAIPEKNILANYYRYLRFFVAGIIFTTIALIITINYLINRFFAPLEKVVNTIRHYDPNKEPTYIPVVSNDEIGKLSSQINRTNRLVWNYTEELRQRQEQIQELIKARDSFIATLTHDLRSPINAEQKALEVILAKKLGNSLDEISEYLEDIYKTNEELLRIVNNLLTVYHYESGQYKPVLEPVKIGELINDSVRTLRHLAIDQESELNESIEPDLPNIMVDKDQITRVITNLISNAIKHNTKGTQITISAKRTDNEIQVSVRDNGKGIPKADRSKIFQRYPTAKRKIGTGLGLYLSKQIIDVHNGKIWFKSEEGKGTTFYFALKIS